MQMPSREIAKKNGQMSDQLAIDATRFREMECDGVCRAGVATALRVARERLLRRVIQGDGVERGWCGGGPKTGRRRRAANERPLSRADGDRVRAVGLDRKKNARGRSDGIQDRREREETGLLLVPRALEQLPLLVLSHLLAALLDHTTHWISPCSAPSAPVRKRRIVPSSRVRMTGRVSRGGARGAGRFRSSPPPCQAIRTRWHSRATVRTTGSPRAARPQIPSSRSTKRLRTLPSIRLTR